MRSSVCKMRKDAPSIVGIESGLQFDQRHDFQIARPRFLHRGNGFRIGPERLERQRLVMRDGGEQQAHCVGYGEAHGREHGGSISLDLAVNTGLDERVGSRALHCNAFGLTL